MPGSLRHRPQQPPVDRSSSRRRGHVVEAAAHRRSHSTCGACAHQEFAIKQCSHTPDQVPRRFGALPLAPFHVRVSPSPSVCLSACLSRAHTRAHTLCVSVFLCVFLSVCRCVSGLSVAHSHVSCVHVTAGSVVVTATVAVVTVVVVMRVRASVGGEVCVCVCVCACVLGGRWQGVEL